MIWVRFLSVLFGKTVGGDNGGKPPCFLPILAFLIMIPCLWFYGYFQYQQGYERKALEMEKAINELNQKAREQERQWAEKLQEVDREKFKELSDAKKRIEKLSRDVANHERRLHVRINKSKLCPPTTSKTSSVDNEEARAELDPRTAGDLIALMARGDEAIIQLNALQDWAEMVTKAK